MTPEQLLNIANNRSLIVVVADGMHEPPLDVLGGRTPWQAADCECMDAMMHDSISLVPDGLEPNTDVALLTLLGYDAGECANCRAPFEALGLGIEVDKDDMVLRCNLVSMHNGMITSHCGEGLTGEQAMVVVDLLNDRLGCDNLHFYNGNGFRALLKVKGMTDLPSSVPPHNILNQPYQSHMIDNATLARINVEAIALLSTLGFPANGIWLWGAGRAGSFAPFAYNGASISGTQLVRGISRAVGMDVIDVDGADGTFTTNLRGKCDAAISAIGNHQFVLVHVEACDEASHSLDVKGKIDMIKRIDTELVAPLREYASGHDVALVITSDHGTSSIIGKHLAGKVPCYVQI